MSRHFIEGIINRASEGGVDFLLEGDKLTLKMLQDKEIDSSLLTLIRENKESIKTFLRDNAVPANGAAGNRKVTPVTNGHGPMPLSFAQERLWFIDRLHGSLPYHMPWVFNLRGNLHRDHLESSFRQIVQRHEVLRTVVREEDGVGHPVVLPAEQWQLKTIQPDGGQPIEQLIERLINTPFDLSHDFMLKVWLIKITEREHLLVTLFHHIAFDGWSIGIMVKELEELYRSKIDNKDSQLRALPVQYSDYAYWQRKYLSGQLLETKLAYWKKQLGGVSPLELPADHARPAIQSTRGAVASSRIDKEVYRQLLELSRQEGVTLFMTMLTAFKVLLYKYTGQADICIGSPAAGRQQQEVEGLIGFFVNTLALRNEVDEKRSFKEFLQQVKQTTLEAYDHQEVPFEKIVEALGVQRDMSRTPVFQLMFALHNMPLAEELKLGDVQLWRKPDSRLSARFDLELEISESADGLVLSCIYCRDLFNEATVRQMLTHYECLLQNILFEPSAAITELNILTAKDLRQVLYSFNDTAVAYPQDKTVVDLFVEQARSTPGAVAVVFEDEQLTYRELDELSNQLAHLLVSKGVGNETLVPVCLDRSLDMLVVIFGIWKAGAAYVPIDPLHPAQRIQYMLEDCGAAIAVCHKGYEHFFANPISLEDAAAMPATPISKTGALSYLIYTSGSTGQPKGVMIEHRSLLNFLLSMRFELEIGQTDRTIAVTTYSFDISCLELYLGLICGATVHIGQLKDGYALKKLVEKVKPTYMQATPSGWQVLLESGWQNESNTTILTGGEAIPDALKETLTGISSTVFNMYGPTETTIWSAMHRLQKGKKVSIGTPIANTKIYILNTSLQPCPIGVQGELCIGGDGLSRGYLNKPELTAEKFIDNPFIKGEKIYKTGDVARWNADGTLEFLGRKDEQVKVRGYRIELGEIETVLNRAPGIQQAVVVAAKDQLVAYAIGGFDKATVISYLRQFLPEYMVPSLMFEVSELPLTPNGKVDRKKLRELELTHTTTAYEAPRNATEQALIAIWQELLNITKLSIHDNFFESGGHSLLAMRMVSMVRKRLGKELAIKEIFLHPTIAQLSRQVENQNEQLIPVIERYEKTGFIPLSFSQERLWFIDKLQGSLQYHMPYVFRMKGNIDAHALEASFREILNRHEVLRTVIAEEDGKGYQQILPVGGWKIHHATQQDIEKLIATPFDLAAGPMFKVWLISVSEQEHILFAMLHHIVFDGWSVGIMVEELVELYNAHVEQRTPALKPLPVQYADYSIWQRKYLSGEILDRKLSYWKKQLQDITPLELPTDNPRPAIQSTNGAVFSGIIQKETLAGLHSFSQQEGTTLFMTLLSAFNVLLYKYCGQEDVCVGSAVAGRNQQETEGLIGFFINTIALRSGVNGHATFRQLLQQVKQTTLDAYDNQDVPFEKIVEALEIPRDLSRTPVFQVMFTLQNAPHAAELTFSNISLTEEKPAATASRFELGFSLTETAGGLEINVTYCRDLYNESTIARLLGHYERLLIAVLNDADAAVARLQMLPPQESAHLLEVFGSSLAPYPKGNKTIVDLFEEQAAKTPDNIAVAFEGSQLTYRQLDEYSNKIAHYLVKAGVRREELVVISVKRSLECIAGIMGILKAGAAYVPVDTNYPDERIAYIVTDTACKVFLGDGGLHERLQLALPGNKVQFVDLKHDAALFDAAPANRINLSDTHQLVYIIYTSGSTGLPKGVMIEHAHLVDHVYGMFKSARLNTCRSFALFASLVADAGHSILFSSLISGGAVHVLSDELLTDGEAVSAYIQQHRIDCIKIVPSLWLSYLDSNFVPLPGKVLIFGGEAFALNILDILRQRNYQGELYNHYGPTEATIGKCIHKIDLGRNYHNVPIGQPFSNTKAYIVNTGGQLCPIGVCGELYLGGEGIARGYLNRPELTSQRFINDPFCEGGKVYKTGDICRWLPDGNIEYMGRKDDQVKIRGHRIELGEIESVLQQFPGIVQAVVALSEDGKRLISCIVAQAQTSKEQLAAYMRSKLPDYMVPAVITQVDAIPLTANGKLDRKKLQQLSAEAASLAKEYTAPTNDAELALATVWQELLGVEKAGIHDNFFELGGDSIITIQVVSRMKRRGYELKPKDLFLHQTIARLSKVMRKSADAAAPRGEQGLLQGQSPLLPVQQSYFENATGNISHFNQSVLLAIDKRISAAALQAVIQVLQDQHDALRFTYRNSATGWVQEYGAAEGRLVVEDVATLAAIAPLADNYQRSLDIEKGGLMRAILFTTPAGETHNRLLLIVHHLGIDSVSWRILLEDLEQLLQKQIEGKPLATAEKGSSYRQWHEALAKYGGSHQLQSQTAYWESMCSSVAPLPVDKHYDGVVLAENIDVVEAILSPAHTQQLLQDVHKAYHTGINDILLAALAKTITAWSGTDRLIIGLEGHGREHIAADVDVSRIVGWFTSVYPVLLETEGTESDGSLLKSIKEQLRSIPAKGIGYGVLKHINKQPSLQNARPWELVFNYLGQSDNVASGLYFSAAKESAGREVSPDMAVHQKMEIVSIVEQGSLKITWKYSSKHYHKVSVTALADQYLLCLQQLTEHCVQQAAQGGIFTPADFNLGSEITWRQLDNFMAANPSVESIYRLSALQQGMLFHGLYDKGSSAYIEQFCCELSGLDTGVFSKSWDALVQRHTILRTAFYHNDFPVPVQCVHAQAKLAIDIIDYSGLAHEAQQRAVKEHSEAERARGFDFRSAPLMRISLLRLAADRYAMVWTFHHMLFDGWSMPVLMEEFLNCYEQLLQGQELPQAETDRYEDYIRYLENRDTEKDAQYWKTYLDKTEQGSLLPFIRTSAGRLKGVGNYREELLELGEELTNGIASFAREHRITINTIMQAAWAYLLYRYTGNADVVYGVTVSGRPADLAGVEQRIGMYINSIPFRTAVQDRSIAEWLQDIQQNQLSAREFSFSAITDIQEWAGIKQDLFDTILVFENYPVSELLSAKQWSLKVENTVLKEHNNYPLSVEITNGKAIEVRFNYNEALLTQDCAQMIAGHFKNIVQQIAAGAAESITGLSLLSTGEEKQLLYDFNDTTADYPKHSTVTDLFEQQVALSPSSIALVFETTQLTYSALDEQSSRLANFLRGNGVTAGSPVAVCMNRSAELIISILAILKAGGAYVPIDPSYPAFRIGYMLEDINATILLTHSSIQLPAGICERIDIDRQSFDKFSPVRPAVQLQPSSLAYVLYTSGSTGTPKGVMVEHRNIVSLVKGVTFVELSGSTVILSTGSPSFDATTIEYWGALLNGGKLVMCTQETLLDTVLLKQAIGQHQVNTMWFTAGWFNELAETGISLFSNLTTILVGGDKLSPAHIAQVKSAYPSLKIINGYGPTENTTFSLTYPIHEVNGDIPIGYSLSNRKAYVLDEQGRLCPVGVAGEIYVGGDGLARGYLNNEQLTKQKFIKDPFAEGERLYKTGDLGRWTNEGSIEYLGRKDEQVKIRGYRIELGEIENALQQLAEVQQAVVLAVEDGSGNKKLIAYAVTSNGFNAEEAMAHLQSRLPEYMAPAAIITVDAMPLTANGKIDRKKLQESAITTTDRQYTAPRNETETAIAGIWKDILEVDAVGIDDNFFELGGHSLLAIRAIAAMRSQLEKEVSIKELFDHPTIKELAAVIAGYGNENMQPAIVKQENRENVPLSFSQERLWFIDKLHGSVQYHMPWVFRLQGELDVDALENAFATIVRRHEVLRTVIREQNGVGCQVVLPAEGWKITQLELNHQPIEELVAVPFDLANDFMLRVWLVKLSANEHLLITVFHHIAFDGWSIGVMVKELEELYKGHALPELAVQYSDYAAWQRNYLSGQVLDEKLGYWKNKLSGVEPLELPLDRVRPAIQSMRGAVVKGAIDSELAGRLQEISQSQGATLFMTLCSAFNILLYKYTGQQDICIGSPIAGRQQQETGDLIGFFVNTLVLRNEIKADQSFTEILQQVKETTLDAYENQDVPFERIVEALGVQRDMSRTPVFQVMFALQNMPAVDGLSFSNVQVTAVDDGVVNAKFDLSLSISESAQGLQLEIIYCADLFDETTVQAFLQHYTQLLHSITNTNTTVAKLAIMSSEEQQQLLQNFSNLTEEQASYPFTLQQALDEQLKAGGSKTAIQYKDRAITYDELHASIGKISWFLRKKLGLSKDKKVVVLVNRSEKLILAILSVMRSGLVYVPIDTSYPEERVLFMIRDAQPSLVITDGECIAAERSGCQSISIDDILAVPRAGTYYEQSIQPADEAYVLYTSGSTGAPKGVVVTHGNMDHLFEFLYVQYVHSAPVMPFLASHSFDISLFQLYLPLLCGGTVLVIDREQLQDAEQLVALLQQSTIIDTVPGLFKLVLNYIEENDLVESFAHVERVFVGGDLIPDDLMHQLGKVFSNAAITVSYGPTEGTIFCTSLPYSAGSVTSSVKGTIIGRPLGSAQLYVLGQSQELLPVGVEGEICIGGPSVSKGYLNQPELTAEKYLSNPYKQGGRIYRTGDAGRWTREGLLEFRGRNDNQVKIRGNRIELGELENKIKELNGIGEAVVILARKDNGEAYLCAFYTGTNKTRSAFEAHLSAFFAESVLPSHYFHIDEIPLTSNAKVDRKKLQEMAAGAAVHGAEYAAPRNQAEQALAEVWHELLGVEQVSIHDNFFQLGGDSIITIQVISRLKRKGYELQPKDIFLHQTIARLGPVMLDRKAFAAVQGEQGMLKGNSPLLPIQQWFFENAPENISHFNQSLLLGIDKSITAAALSNAVKSLVQHHDALRYRYHHSTTGWQQEYGAAEGELIVEELSCSAELLAEEIRRLSNHYQRSLDIEEGRLVKMVLIKTPAAETHNRLLAIVHHLAIDGVSWRILVEDLEQLLMQHALGLKGSSCRQWHDALLKYSNSNRLKKQIDYWENAVSRVMPLPVDSNYEEVAENSPAGYTLRLSKERTQQLLQQAGKAYHTGINDLLLAALAQTIAKWSNTNHITIGLEAHGREDIAAKTDLGRTVGWFTSVFPLVLNTEGIANESDLLKTVKEQIRCVPDKGLGYGVLKYMSRHAALQGSDPWEIVFNYLGQSDNVISSPFFTAAKESTGDNVGEGEVQRNKMEVLAIVEEGALKISWRYSTKHYRESTIGGLATNFISNLEHLVQHCSAQLANGPVHTPSDFGLGREVSFRELDAFMESLPQGAAVQRIYRLSGLQEGMLFHGLYNKEAGAYMEQFCADLINPDINAFTSSWQQILERHTILRSSFHSDAFSVPVQCVHAAVPLPVEIIDYRFMDPAQQEQAVQQFITADRDRGFNFKQPPLMRITLVQLSDDRYRMVWTFHHILFDGWSMPVLMEEFLKTYEGESNGSFTEDRFEEFIRYIEAKDQEQEKAYWQQYLRHVERGSFLPFIDITKERTKSAGVYAEQFVRLDKQVTGRLQAYARQHRLTVNTIMQGVWSYLLYRYTGDAKVTYGVTVSGRPEDLAGVERRVGMYINTLPLHTTVQEESNIVEWLSALQQEQIASRQYQHSALVNVQEWAGIKGELFDTIMVFENYPVDKMVASRRWKLQVENIRALGKTNYPLGILIDAGEEITACFKYNTSILDQVYVQKIAAHFRQVLLQLPERPAGRLGDIEMITPAERSQLLHRFGWCEADYPRTKTMIELFERQAKRQPETLALVGGRQQLTYRELDQRANQLAQYLRSIGVKENSCVPLCIDRPFEAIIAILAILKAGCAYVPVDPDSPRSRMEYVLSDTGANVLLTTAQCRKLISYAFDHIIEIDNCDAQVAKLGKRKPARRITPDHLLYVIYTSGSTGAPKGVMVKHQSIMDYAFGLTQKTRIHECSSFALVSAIFTDLGNTVIYSSLIFGGTLHVFGREMINDPAAMCNYFESHHIDCVKIVPSHWKALSSGEKMLLPARWLVFGGEALHAEVVEKISGSGASCGIVNHYGPTETTIGKLLHVVEPGHQYANTIPIGRPFSNTRVYVLSPNGQLCPLGVPGELFIGGHGVAAGYLNNASLTSEKFIPDHFCDIPGATMYRTGDVVKYLPDGNILFIGRADNQVKIRGYRVEPGEIESVLQQAPGVVNGAVNVHEDSHANKRLVAYVTGEGIDKESVMLYLRSRLPEYMVPAVLMQIPAIPLTPNGKIDRRKLPAPDMTVRSASYHAPRNTVESQLAEIWQELLGIERVGIHDNFFELGGNSLLVMRMDAYIKRSLQISIPMQVLFQLSSISEISKYLDVEMQAGKQEDAGFEIVTI